MPIRVGGAGNKAMQVLEGNADVYLSLSERVKYWDICAGHALFKSRFGFVNDKDGNKITYDPEIKNFSLSNGIIFQRTHGFRQVVEKRLRDYLDQTEIERLDVTETSRQLKN